MKIAFSVNGVPTKLTEKQLKHIYNNHPEMKTEEDRILETVSNPNLVQQGDVGSLLAIKKFDKTPVTNNKYLNVAYKEPTQTEGFVLTAFYSNKLKNRKIIWENK